MSARTRKPRKERHLTTTYTHRDYYDDGFWVRSQSFPVLRFGGAWLAQAGFAIGQRVRVKVHKHRIVIERAT